MLSIGEFTPESPLDAHVRTQFHRLILGQSAFHLTLQPSTAAHAFLIVDYAKSTDTSTPASINVRLNWWSSMITDKPGPKLVFMPNLSSQQLDAFCLFSGCLPITSLDYFSPENYRRRSFAHIPRMPLLIDGSASKMNHVDLLVELPWEPADNQPVRITQWFYVRSCSSTKSMFDQVRLDAHPLQLYSETLVSLLKHESPIMLLFKSTTTHRDTTTEYFCIQVHDGNITVSRCNPLTSQLLHLSQIDAYLSPADQTKATDPDDDLESALNETGLFRDNDDVYCTLWNMPLPHQTIDCIRHPNRSQITHHLDLLKQQLFDRNHNSEEPLLLDYKMGKRLMHDPRSNLESLNSLVIDRPFGLDSDQLLQGFCTFSYSREMLTNHGNTLGLMEDGKSESVFDLEKAVKTEGEKQKREKANEEREDKTSGVESVKWNPAGRRPFATGTVLQSLGGNESRYGARKFEFVHVPVAAASATTVTGKIHQDKHHGAVPRQMSENQQNDVDGDVTGSAVGVMKRVSAFARQKMKRKKMVSNL